MLPMDQIEPDIGHLIPVCMELPVSVGAVDNLFITPGGNLVVVEVKLWGNPEARRKVVAQALEYATALFKLDYAGLEKAVMKADFNGADAPESLYSLVDGADAPSESVFADRVGGNLREGRIAVLTVGDQIRPQADELVAGLQAHANFHFTFAVVEVPVYSRGGSDPADDFVVVPRTLVKTVTIPRFTIRADVGATVVSDAGTDECAARHHRVAQAFPPRDSSKRWRVAHRRYWYNSNSSSTKWPAMMSAPSIPRRSTSSGTSLKEKR